jgi:hypothetical protein
MPILGLGVTEKLVGQGWCEQVGVLVNDII